MKLFSKLIIDKKILKQIRRGSREDVDIRAQEIFRVCYFIKRWRGDKIPPPRDVSSDSLSSDSESEDEEVDVAPEATAGTFNQKPLCHFVPSPRCPL
ncbi:hypothetical protein Tco_0232933 [Tanacetum coccineum]